MSVYLNLGLVIDNSTKTVVLSDEGTVDWYGCGELSADLIGFMRQQVSYQVSRKKNVEPQLLRGFGFRINAGFTGPITQTVQRTVSAAASDNTTGAAYSTANKTGFYQLSGTALYTCGYRMVLRALPWRTLRLRCYSTDWRCNLQGTAKIMDGETEEASQVVNNTGINGNNMHEWQVDFRGGSYRSWMIFDMAIVGAATGADQNYGVQGFTLSVVP